MYFFRAVSHNARDFPFPTLFMKYLLSLCATTLLLIALPAHAEDAMTDEATTDAETTETTTEEAAPVTAPAMSEADMMRDALKKNRERLLKTRDLTPKSRALQRVIRITQPQQAERMHYLKIRNRQMERAERRGIEDRVGTPNAGIRRQGAVLDTQRTTDNDGKVNPVGRMRLFPQHFED